MSKADIASKTPFPMEVEEGKTYKWCACGRSSNQPFCDGSHQGTDFAPVSYTAPKDKIVFFCGCKQSAKAPVCDGTHSSL